MTDPWILHEHRYAPCGCGVIVSLYHDIDGVEYADGTNRVTLLRCLEHPHQGTHIYYVDNAILEEDVDA